MDVPAGQTVSRTQLGLFSLTMINVAAIASLRDLPQMAEYGVGCIFFYLLAGLVFFMPVSLVAAELTTGWPQKGGVYVWGVSGTSFTNYTNLFRFYLTVIKDPVCLPPLSRFQPPAIFYHFYQL